MFVKKMEVTDYGRFRNNWKEDPGVPEKSKNDTGAAC